MEAKHLSDGSVEVSLTQDDIDSLATGRSCMAENPTEEGFRVYASLNNDPRALIPEAQILETFLGVYITRPYLQPGYIEQTKASNMALGDVPTEMIGGIDQSPVGKKMLSKGAFGVIIRAAA